VPLKLWERLRKQGNAGWYTHYLTSHHWRRLRKQAMARANYRCMQCGVEDPNQDTKRGTRLQVHHHTYERIGAEHLEDLAVVCGRCHQAEHKPKLWRIFGKLGTGKVNNGAELGYGKIDTRKKLSGGKGK
jgi:ribosomal protein L44E